MRQPASPHPCPHLRNHVPTSPAPPSSQRLCVSQADRSAAHLTNVSGPPLPPEDQRSLLRLALTAGWNLKMLEAPAHVPRKCPYLPDFFPRAVAQGLTLSGLDLPNINGNSPVTPSHSFHGEVSLSADMKPRQCPYRG